MLFERIRLEQHIVLLHFLLHASRHKQQVGDDCDTASPKGLSCWGDVWACKFQFAQFRWALRGRKEECLISRCSLQEKRGKRNAFDRVRVAEKRSNNTLHSWGFGFGSYCTVAPTLCILRHEREYRFPVFGLPQPHNFGKEQIMDKQTFHPCFNERIHSHLTYKTTSPWHLT